MDSSTLGGTVSTGLPWASRVAFSFTHSLQLTALTSCINSCTNTPFHRCRGGHQSCSGRIISMRHTNLYKTNIGTCHPPLPDDGSFQRGHNFHNGVTDLRSYTIPRNESYCVAGCVSGAGHIRYDASGLQQCLVSSCIPMVSPNLLFYSRRLRLRRLSTAVYMRLSGPH